MASLSARLKAQVWLEDWPLQAQRDFRESPKTLPASLGYPRMQRVCQAALSQADEIVTVQEVHHLLDRLESWNGRHASALTWPPTLEGFTKAIARDIASGHEDTILMQILVPSMVNLALASADPRQASASTSSPAAAPVAPDTSPDATATPSAPAPPIAPKGARPDRDPAQASRRTAASPALALKLLEIANSNPGGIASEKIDATIKSLIADQTRSDPTRGTSARFKFFSRDLMPSVALLDPPSIQKLMQCWPANAHVDIARPEVLLSRHEFWIALKAGGAESRIAVMSQVLPKIFNGDSWSPDRRLEALQQMMARVRSPEEFSRRLELWGAWGGNLDAPIIKPSSGSDNDFSAPSVAPLTARSWIEESMPSHKDQLSSPRRSPRSP